MSRILRILKKHFELLHKKIEKWINAHLEPSNSGGGTKLKFVTLAINTLSKHPSKKQINKSNDVVNSFKFKWMKNNNLQIPVSKIITGGAFGFVN